MSQFFTNTDLKMTVIQCFSPLSGQIGCIKYLCDVKIHMEFMYEFFECLILLCVSRYSNSEFYYEINSFTFFVLK